MSCLTIPTLSTPTVIEIPRTECIGNSLQSINGNDQRLAEAISVGNTSINTIAAKINEICALLPSLSAMRAPELVTFQQIFNGDSALTTLTSANKLGQSFAAKTWTNLLFHSTPVFDVTSGQTVTIGNGLTLSPFENPNSITRNTFFNFLKTGIYRLRLEMFANTSNGGVAVSRLVSVDSNGVNPTLFKSQAGIIRFTSPSTAAGTTDGHAIDDLIHISSAGTRLAIQLYFSFAETLTMDSQSLTNNAYSGGRQTYADLQIEYLGQN